VVVPRVIVISSDDAGAEETAKLGALPHRGSEGSGRDT
jgi:hypothetical protein